MILMSCDTSHFPREALQKLARHVEMPVLSSKETFSFDSAN